jgi:hypothetical protein
MKNLMENMGRRRKKKKEEEERGRRKKKKNLLSRQGPSPLVCPIFSLPHRGGAPCLPVISRHFAGFLNGRFTIRDADEGLVYVSTIFRVDGEGTFADSDLIL